MVCKEYHMRSYTVIILLLLSVALYSNSNTEVDLDQVVGELYIMTVDTITPEEMMELDNYHLFDIRSQTEFEISHIEGANFIDYKNFSVKNFPDIPKDEPIILYCSIGYRSERIGEDLQEIGYTRVYNLYGGLINWVNKGLPVYKDGRETNRVHGYSKRWSRYITNPNIIVVK